MNRRLLGVLVLVAVALLAVARRRVVRRRRQDDDHADDVVVRQPGPGPRAGAQAAEQGLREEPPRREDQPRLQGLQQPRRHGAARARVGQRPRRDRGEPGLPDRRAAREGEADPPADEVRQEVRVGQALRAVDLGDVPLDARRQVVRQGPGLGHRADRPERRRLLQQEEAARSSASTRTSCRRRSRGSTAMLATLRAKLPDERAGDRGGQQGGLRLHPPLRRHLGRLRASRRRVRNWIYHVPGSRYDTPGTIKALGQAPAVGARRATSTTTTTRVGYDAVGDGSSRRARARSGSAATGTRRSSRPASAPRTSA